MFLRTTRSGYTRDAQQFAHGRFLMVFSHNQYKWSEETGRPWTEFPEELSRKLYATVRFVRMRQFGPWMMATVRIGRDTLTLSGTYGSDGLPMDYEEVPKLFRHTLVELPPDLAEIFWKGGGHNCAGSEAPAMLAWARKQFPEPTRRR